MIKLMTLINKIATALLLFCCSGCWMMNPYGTVSASRTGENFEVRVNGVPTRSIPQRYFIDSKGFLAREINWEANSDGNLCLSIDPRNNDFRLLTSATLTLVQINENTDSELWPTITPLPPLQDYTQKTITLPVENYCPNEFQLTPRIKYDKLKTGTYFLGIHLNGLKNWDAQNIRLNVR